MGELDQSRELFDFFQSAELSGLNVIGHKDWEAFHRNLIDDVFVSFAQISRFRSLLKASNSVADFGSGGGFPLFPLMMLRRQENLDIQHFVAIDSRAKKLNAVQLVHERFFSDISLLTIHSRFENLTEESFVGLNNFELGVVKAVGPVDRVVEQIRKCVWMSSRKVPLILLFFKNQQFWENEEASIRALEAKKGSDILWTQEYRLELEPKPRLLVCIRVSS